MEVITSTQNQQIVETKKLHQKKYREARGLFLVEGLRLAEEAVKTMEVEEAFFHEAFSDTIRGESLLKKLAAMTPRLYQVGTRVLNSLSETESPQGIILTCRLKEHTLASLKQSTGPIVVLDGLADPGNLGTIIRTLWAAGGSGVICLEGTADPFNGKVIRSSMGGIFNLPIITRESWPKVSLWAKAEGYKTVAADLRGAKDYRQLSWDKKTLLCIGNEAQGLLNIPPTEVDARVFIPLYQGAESLNAAVAAGILIYETIRDDF